MTNFFLVKRTIFKINFSTENILSRDKQNSIKDIQKPVGANTYKFQLILLHALHNNK
jgi:isocitrate lyase